jgi:hypothetical protein
MHDAIRACRGCPRETVAAITDRRDGLALAST